MKISDDEKFKELLKKTVKSFAAIDNRPSWRQLLSLKIPKKDFDKRLKEFTKNLIELSDYIDNYVAGIEKKKIILFKGKQK
jgi:hypothetical protein